MTLQGRFRDPRRGPGLGRRGLHRTLSGARPHLYELRTVEQFLTSFALCRTSRFGLLQLTDFHRPISIFIGLSPWASMRAATLCGDPHE